MWRHCRIVTFRSVPVRDPARLLAWLDREPVDAAGDAVDAVRRALARPAATEAAVSLAPHGSTICYVAGPDGGRRRALEFDRHGNLLAALRWRPEALDRAWVRIPDRSWLEIEPGVTADAPWGPSADRLLRAERPGGPASALTVFEALDYLRLDRIPVLAEPGRVPPGGGTAVLNLLAALAADQGVPALTYRGPYPGEHLFLSLLESFRYAPAGVPDPLAALAAGTLNWQPAPHERLLVGDVCVHLRGRVEKAVCRGRTYYRPDWQGVGRHAPRRVRDEAGTVRCSLWALGEVIEDHLVLAPDGEVLEVREPRPEEGTARPLPAAVVAGVAAVVAATSADALAPFMRRAAEGLALEWGPVAGDLVEVNGGRARLASALERVARRRLAGAAGPDRPAAALAVLGEIAQLLGDLLRGRAQALLAAQPPGVLEAALWAPPPPEPDRARVIADAVEALLGDLGG
jgi:hypothetical protein